VQDHAIPVLGFLGWGSPRGVSRSDATDRLVRARSAC